MTFAISIVVFAAAAMLVHELGHMAAAGTCRVRTKELGLGLGPVLFRLPLRGITFSLRAIPLGSFVRLDGLHGRPVWQQLFVHVGGMLANGIIGLLFFNHLFGWLNLLIAASNLLPIYQHDGWKCGLVLVRALVGKKSRPVEWTYTFSGGFVSLLFVWVIIQAVG